MRVGIAGLGTVGSGVAQVLLEGSGRFPQVSRRPELVAVAEADWGRVRGVALPESVRRENDGMALVSAPDVDAVVELIGGTGVAYEVIKGALEAGKPVVTANKALLAERGEELFRLAWEKGLSIGFEGSVCGGIPLIRAIRSGLVADRISAFKGIVNGTCNFILSRMYRDGTGYETALAAAQAAGYAEADPTLDVSGKDSAHKLVLLAGLAFGELPSLDEVAVKGIDGVDGKDVAYARELGYATKLIASGRRRCDGTAELSVYPTLLAEGHPLAAVSGAFNAVWVESDGVGASMYYGPGDGRTATASAVVSDIVDAALGSARAEYERLRFVKGGRARVAPFEKTEASYYLRFTVKDEYGVLGSIASALGMHEVSIASVVQKASAEPSGVPIVITTHEASEAGVQGALREIDAMPFVTAATTKLRIEDEEKLL